MRRRAGGRAGAVAILAVALAGCADAAVVEGPVPTVPEVVDPAVPTLAPTGAATGTATPAPATPTAPASSAPPTTGPGASAAVVDPASPPSGAAVLPAPAVDDLAAVAAVLAQDPDRAGARGAELLGELQRVLDRPQQDRIDRAVDRTRQWADDGQLDPEVAAAAIAALQTHPVEDRRAGDDGGREPDDDGDDDD